MLYFGLDQPQAFFFTIVGIANDQIDTHVDVDAQALLPCPATKRAVLCIYTYMVPAPIALFLSFSARFETTNKKRMTIIGLDLPHPAISLSSYLKCICGCFQKLLGIAKRFGTSR